MSELKLFTKPKVRFTQNIENEEKTEESGNTSEKKSVTTSNGPKIRSIVSLKKPVKILNANQQSSEFMNKRLNSKDKGNEFLTESCDVYSKNKSVVLCDTTERANDQKPLNDATNTQNIKANYENTDKLKVTKERTEKDTLSLTPVLQDNVRNKKVPQSTSNNNEKVLKLCHKNKRGKENKESTMNIKSSQITRRDTSNLYSKANTVKQIPTVRSIGVKKSTVTQSETAKSSKPCFKKSTAKDNVKTRAITTSSNASKRLNPKFNVNNVMPCHKYTRVSSKAKTSPVKKTVIRDIVGHKIKPYVGPSVSHKNQESYKASETKEDVHITSDVSGDKLARPEYNSIMCTINKMNQVKKQKVVTDYEHLPTAYKNIVNGKISNALDFPLDESIYKNLVDLSIDEKQLPGRLMRSKDPEPRQRDITPVLSNFFTPMSTEEYCSFALIKPRTPEITDSWNAFRISDKIVEWKQSVEHG